MTRRAGKERSKKSAKQPFIRPPKCRACSLPSVSWLYVDGEQWYFCDRHIRMISAYAKMLHHTDHTNPGSRASVGRQGWLLHRSAQGHHRKESVSKGRRGR